MSSGDISPEWPETAEEGEVLEPEPADTVAEAELRPPQPVEEGEDDRLYVAQMVTLTQMTQGKLCLIGVSDGYTDHAVGFRRLYTEGRKYMIVYSDSWPIEWGTFLQEGKNAAGVRARPYNTENREWVITHDEFFRVLVHVATLPPQAFES
jgi:hypothetical protein